LLLSSADPFPFNEALGTRWVFFSCPRETPTSPIYLSYHPDRRRDLSLARWSPYLNLQVLTACSRTKC
jgi:hypothetical protein